MTNELLLKTIRRELEDDFIDTTYTMGIKQLEFKGKKIKNWLWYYSPFDDKDEYIILDKKQTEALCKWMCRPGREFALDEDEVMYIARRIKQKKKIYGIIFEEE